MFSWKGTLGFAVCAALASATMAHGEQPAGPVRRINFLSQALPPISMTPRRPRRPSR